MRFGFRELMLLVILLGVPLASFFLVFRPMNAEIRLARQEVDHRKGMLEKLRTETARSADLRRANDEIAKTIKGVEERLPSTKEVDNIVRQISELAVDSGLEPPQLKTAKVVKMASYMDQPLEITTQGSFDGYYDFLLKLERLPRITRISDMDLERHLEKEGVVKATFTLSIYFQDDGALKP